jgi:hypothetical protein
MFDRKEIAAACRKWAGFLQAPDGIDGARLLWAIAGCESSFGLNCKPRHEPFYHRLAVEKKNAQLVKLTELFGCDAHSSFGPWQLLVVNCSSTMRPEDFLDVNRACMETALFLNRRVLGAEHADTVQKIAVAYNSGKWEWANMPPGVAQYARQCQGFYDTEPLAE